MEVDAGMNLNRGYNKRAKKANLIIGSIPIPPHSKLPVEGSIVVIPVEVRHHIISKVKNDSTYISISNVEIVECIDAAYKVDTNSNPKTTGIKAVANLFIVGFVRPYQSNASSH